MKVSNLLIARFSILIILCVATDIFWSATGLNSDCGKRDGWIGWGTMHAWDGGSSRLT